MKKHLMFFVSVCVACAFLQAQAIAQQPLTPASGVTEAERDDATVEISFLHRGSANFLPIDDALGVVFFTVEINGQKTTALLDTGADGTAIDLELAKQLGLEIRDTGTTAKTAFGSIPNKSVEALDLEVPGQFSLTGSIGAKDLSGFSRAIGRDVGVVIGFDLLRSMSFLLDSKRKRIVFIQSGAISPRNKANIRLPIEGNVLDGEISGQPVRLKVDLGSNSDVLVLEKSWADVLGERPTKELGTSYDATGKKTSLTGIEDVELAIGPIVATIDVQRIPYEEESVDALLGYPIFKERVTVFDYPAGHITIIE